MRNGNSHIKLRILRIQPFLPYLWGMETFYHPRVHFLHCLFLPYLWGMETGKSANLSSTFFRVLTVPMRNGNNFGCSASSDVSVRSYRTYEEWKRIIFFEVVFIPYMFLPYLWGMETAQCYFITTQMVQFLPYLWGMETLLSTYSFRFPLSVLTVPMRNGNMIDSW